MLAALATVVLAASSQTASDTCIAFVSENLARGRENFYTYYRFSDQRVTLKEGDVLVYSIFLDPKNPQPKGGIDVDFTDNGQPLRDLGLVDQNEVRAHGDGLLTQAVGKWHTRRIGLKGQAGRTTAFWSLNFEGDATGRYAEWVDDVFIEHADGSKTAVYTNGLPPSRQLIMANGYSKMPYCVVVDRTQVTEKANVDALVAQVEVKGKRLASIENARKDIALAREFLKANKDPELEVHVREASAMLDAIEQKEATPEEVQAALHAANHALSHTHPVMRQYTGHLVGHAHIDLQWLWEWQEGLVVTHDTFNQAVKFMDEFPGFTFSQSSSFLYKATEKQYPELFAQIKRKVESGQWEIVGGRICEGDTNMISPESHARQFLYGQRYFREKFGKTARVAWEPDTFGHNAQMPQIAKLGGCDAYYFCRGGKGKPLFWWEALDGTKMLSFDEPATGSWYNSDLSYQQFQEMLDNRKQSGAKDTLWVYGVGNHGGGPTREMIQQALGWMKDPSKPKVKFSTATQFFDKLKTYDLSKIPTVKDELNPVFDGCYTTHSEVKQLNRQAEAATTAAESIATLASLRGFEYPKAAFRRNWEDICYNHHHDTLPGSGVHAPYEKTKVQLQRVVLDDRDIVQRALESMTVQVKAPKGISTMVANPSGWKRSGWVETYLVKSGWDADSGVNESNAVVVAPDGTKYPVQVVDATSHKVRFWAGDVPAFGYKVFNFQAAKEPLALPKVVRNDDAFEFGNLKVRFDFEKGAIASLYDKRTKAERVVGLAGLPEAHYEDPHGMSAWVIGGISKVEPLKLVHSQVIDEGRQTKIRCEYVLKAHNAISRDSLFVQTFILDPAKDIVEVEVDCDWNAIGTGSEPTPLIRVAFGTAPAESARYEIPFGSIVRPNKNIEVPALQWADQAGLAVLNDSKHGYSSDGSSLRLTTIRSSYEPDPVPNPGHHHWRYAMLPHGNETSPALLTKAATEFNVPLVSATVPYDAHGNAPLQYSLATFEQPGTVPTCLKRSEDGNDLVIRYFEANGSKGTSSFSLSEPVAQASWVNFVEDPFQVGGSSGIPLGQRIGGTMRPFEIRTAKVRLGKR
jgi:alpha-mannosidase